MSKPSAAAVASQSRKFMGRSYSEMDCQAFVEASLELVGVHKNLAGSNAWYRTMTWTGTPEECKAKFGTIPVGAFLFIHSFDGGEPSKYHSDGRGNASHIGIKTGSGLGAIHSSSSRGCVCESKFEDRTIPNGGWNTVGLWDALDYDGVSLTEGQTGETAPSSDTPNVEPTFTPGTTATVVATSGKTVKMRQKPSKNCNLYWDVPIGAVIDVRGPESAGWYPVRYEHNVGYMMAEFVQLNTSAAVTDPTTGDIPGEVPPADEAVSYAVEIYDLTKEQADAIKAQYPHVKITQAVG